MAQTKEGALKEAAKKTGVTPEEYLQRHRSGQKWCVLCRAWHERSAFGGDASRWDELCPSCREARNRQRKDRYIRKPPRQKGNRFVSPRAGDNAQARRRVNYLVEARLIPRPNDLPCTDCGHIWRLGERRHEYDHHLGYAAEHHEHVVPVCTHCHKMRAIERANGDENRMG